LRAWLKRSAAKYQRVRFVDARRDTVLLRWIKFIHGLERKLPMAKTISPGWNTATALLIEAWPQQARIADFKGQTPLMLAADYGDVPLVKLLMSHLKVEDLDAQDFGGRTALHAAFASRSPECVAAVLERNPNVDRVSKGERNTVLHTAVRFGQPESVRLILDVYPGLAAQANAEGKTPFNIAAGISENWASWDQYMHRQNRQTGTIEDFADICQMLTVDKSAGR
jgi:ankyrin repeat protein